MECPNTKSAHHKPAKSSPQSAISSARGVMRSIPPQQSYKNQTLSRDETKERQQVDTYKVSPKHPAKENTKPVDIKLHTQQRAVKRAMFNYSVATKLYLIEQQKKVVEKVQKIIEEEEVRMLRKEMVPRAQLMPLFDRPFFPQRSTRRLTIPREPCFQSSSRETDAPAQPASLAMSFSIFYSLKSIS